MEKIVDIASFAGQKLLCRTEYHAGAVAVASMLYAKRSRNEVELKQNGILFGSSFPLPLSPLPSPSLPLSLHHHQDLATER